MAVAHDAATAPLGSGTGEISNSHTPVGTPKGVVVLITQDGSGADQVSSVTYGGVALKRERFEAQTSGETGAGYAYVLGSGVPTGKQTVVVKVSGAANKVVVCCTVTAATATTEVAAANGTKSGGVTNPSFQLATGVGVETVDYGCAHSGAQTASVSPGTGYTQIHEVATGGGSSCASFIRKTVNGTGGNITVSWTWNNDECAAAGIAIKEGPAGSALSLELEDSASFSESRGAGAARTQSDVLAVAEALSRSPHIGRGDQVALVDTLARAFGFSAGDAVTVADALANRADLTQAELVGLEDLLATAWIASREVSDVIGTEDTRTGGLAKALAETTAFGELLQVDAAVQRGDSVGLLDLLELALRRVLEDTLGLSESVAHAFGLSLSDGLALLDQVEGTGAAATALEDTLALGDQHSLGVGRLKVEGLLFADSLAKALAHEESDGIALDDSLGKRISRSVADALATVDGLAREVLMRVADLVGLSDSTELDGGTTSRATRVRLKVRAATSAELDVDARTDVDFDAHPATALALDAEPTTLVALRVRAKTSATLNTED